MHRAPPLPAMFRSTATAVSVVDSSRVEPPDVEPPDIDAPDDDPPELEAAPVASPRVDSAQLRHSARNAVVVAIGYAASVRFTEALLSTPALPPFLCIPSAFILTALLLTRPARWWIVLASTFVGQWIASIGQHASIATFFSAFAIDAVCATLAAALIRRHVDLTTDLRGPSAIGAFTGVALIAPIIGLLGLAAMFGIRVPPHVITGNAPGGAPIVGTSWIVAVLASALAYVTVVPAVLAGRAAVRRSLAGPGIVIPWGSVIEATALTAAVAVVSAIAFSGFAPDSVARTIGLLAPLPVALWATFRFGLAGAASALLIGVSVAMRGLVHGIGFLPGLPTASDVVVHQALVFVFSTLLLLFAAVLDERRHTYGQLGESDQRYAFVTRAGSVFAYMLDRSSDAVTTDAPLADLLGVSTTERQSPTWWWQRVHPDDRPRLRRAWADRRANARPGRDLARIDFRMLDQDGHVHWFRDTPDIHATTEPGTPIITGAIADVTDLKNAERDAAQRSRELAHVARTSIIGELAAALAHEIRQPLTAILINSQTAVRVLDTQPRDTDAVREILYQLAADGRRAGEVIQRVRAFARKDDLERGPIDLNAMLRDAVQLVRHDTIRRRVEIRFALAHETMIVVGDRVQLQQVVLNLVLNALEALAERPPQSDRLVLIETARAASHTATITIRDTGPGVALERQAAIFEPFVTSKSNGLGVGLSITRTIVEAHGGIIWCESDPSVGGAAFIVALPLVSHG